MDSCLTVAQGRQRIDKALQDAKLLRSRHAPELFGLDTDHLQDEAYSIAAPSSVIHDFDGRENIGDEGEAETIYEVRTCKRLRSDGVDGDYNKALDHEHRVIRTVLCDTDRSLSFHLAVEGVPQRAVSPSGEWLVSRIRFKAYHRFLFV